MGVGEGGWRRGGGGGGVGEGIGEGVGDLNFVTSSSPIFFFFCQIFLICIYIF